MIAYTDDHIVMLWRSGLSTADIAEKTGLTEAEVYNTLCRCLDAKEKAA